MTITVVTGTYNRLPLLKRMIASARLARPVTIPLDFVVVDGGSNDGTPAWAASQPDVTFIQQGALLGAIRAFDEGALAATGEYVILANDDIEFTKGAILAALVHLERHPLCGAVAFADDRPATGYGTGFKVQVMNAVAPNNTGCVVYYAQVGMFRRWLGDWCQWWGSADEGMEGCHTYGGDNYLSARIWEAGYTVEAVAGATVKDLMLDDELRAANHAKERGRPAVYHRRYPQGPTIAAQPTIPNPQREQLRVLYLPIYEPGNHIQKLTKRGLREALARRGYVLEADYLNERVDIPAVVQAFKPHLMLTQMHDAVNLPSSVLIECKRRQPSMVIVNWNGDARGLLEQPYLELLKHVDLQLVVNAEPLDTYRTLGINADYWQIGYEEADPTPHLENTHSHDVVFLGNCYSDDRRALGRALQAIGLNVGLYGDGWEDGKGSTLYDFDRGAAIYQKAKIAVSDTFPGTTAFVSNRLFQALAAGAFVLQQHIPDFEWYTGMKAGEHYAEWTTIDDLMAKIASFSTAESRESRETIARAGASFVREHFNFDAQADKLFAILEKVSQYATV